MIKVNRLDREELSEKIDQLSEKFIKSGDPDELIKYHFFCIGAESILDELERQDK